MSEKNFSEEEVITLAKKIASQAVDEVIRAAGGSHSHGGLGHSCQTIHFNCNSRYDCKAPDDCILEFKCKKTYNEPSS